MDYKAPPMSISHRASTENSGLSKAKILDALACFYYRVPIGMLGLTSNIIEQSTVVRFFCNEPIVLPPLVDGDSRISFFK